MIDFEILKIRIMKHFIFLFVNSSVTQLHSLTNVYCTFIIFYQFGTKAIQNS